MIVLAECTLSLGMKRKCRKGRGGKHAMVVEEVGKGEGDDDGELMATATVTSTAM